MKTYIITFAGGACLEAYGDNIIDAINSIEPIMIDLIKQITLKYH